MWVPLHPLELLLHSAAASQCALHELRWVARSETATPSSFPPCSPELLLLVLDTCMYYSSLHIVVCFMLYVTTVMQLVITAWFCWCDHMVLLPITAHWHVHAAAGAHVPASDVNVWKKTLQQMFAVCCCVQHCARY